MGARDLKGKEAEADIRRLTGEAGSRPVALRRGRGYITPFCGLGADAEVLADYSNVKRRARRDAAEAGRVGQGELRARSGHTLAAWSGLSAPSGIVA